jgi:tetratricopeptide (TPR) repeat protein
LISALSGLGYDFELEKFVVKIDFLYNQGQYQKTIENIVNVFQTTKNIPDSSLIRLYTYQAFSYVALDKKEQALNSFRYLLILNPKLELDPRFVSPKIIEIFEESKRIKGDSIRLMPPPFMPMDRTSSLKNRAMRSLLYPGLGQLYQGNKTKGYLFLGLETASIIGLVTSHFLVNSTHRKYLDAQTQDEIDERYKNYAVWYKVRIGFAVSSVGIWILNYIDATLSN